MGTVAFDLLVLFSGCSLNTQLSLGPDTGPSKMQQLLRYFHIDLPG